MSDTNTIEVGDYVRVFLPGQHNENFHGVVLYTPCATGDCWRIRDRDGMLRYVQTFTEILLLNKKPA